MKPIKNRYFCNGCNRVKMLFKSEKKAENFIKYNSDEILNETGIAPVRAYYCPFCGGWHITSSAVQYTRKNSDRYLSAVSFWGQNKQHLKQVSKEMKDEMFDIILRHSRSRMCHASVR